MALDVSKITSSSIFQAAGRVSDKVSNAIGGALVNSPHKDTFQRALNHLAPTGANNAFITMAGLMSATVILPRVLTAAKRNPDNKEATRDEIKEILFRDVQTVLIVLFALKATNSIVGGLTTKFGGLPMTTKPYQQLFNSTEKGFEGFKAKGRELIEHPIEKLKIIGKNILDTFHPTEGVRNLTNDEFVAKYSNYSSVDEIIKMLNEVEYEKGNKQKVFDKIMDSLIETQTDIIEGNSKKGIVGLIKKIARTSGKDGNMVSALLEQKDNAEAIKAALVDLKAKGPEELKNLDNKAIENILIAFFKDQQNSLVMNAKGLNAILRTGALAFEATYLGFGLPAINQIRLEKKYLKKEGRFMPEYKPDASAVLMAKNIKANKVDLYHGFIKK